MEQRGPIDVVIPVYDARELTRACIESLYAHVAEWLGEVHVHDNASGAETARMLDALAADARYPRLHVHHAETNTGFGDAVNQGVGRTRSDPVLVLNSDVEATDDFIAPLVEALAARPRLAVVTPAGNTFESYDLDAYAQHGGCVATHNLYAYAFLIRRSVFVQAGGFDPCFGLGYYEDSDLSRKLIAAGHQMAVHAGSRLRHAIHGSFDAVPRYRELMARNRRLYYARYPQAQRRVLLLSARADYTQLPEPLQQAAREVLEDGGEVRWMASGTPCEQPALGVRGERYGTVRAARTLLRRRRKTYRRFTDLWLLEDAPRRARALLPLARHLELALRHFDSGGDPAAPPGCRPELAAEPRAGAGAATDRES